MKTYFDWFKYNSQRNSDAIKIYNYNLKSKVNYIEKGVHKNVRDIYALSLLLAKKTNGISNILDFGSNLIPQSNLINKIDISKYIFFIYNPFVKKINKKLKFKFKIINKIKDLKKDKFDLIYFGSCLQYIKNLQDVGNLSFIKKTKYILISHTPISIGNYKTYQENQTNAKNLIQNIHSYEEISKKLLKKKFSLKFQSINEFKYSGLKKKKKNVFFLNLLFKNKN
tara:strand:+ start:4263 stop:4937 length:675 start_codon:yes stop_codon:yes gene_type:complete